MERDEFRLWSPRNEVYFPLSNRFLLTVIEAVQYEGLNQHNAPERIRPLEAIIRKIHSVDL